MSYFSVISIGQPEADEAYAFVRTLAPEVPPDLWDAFAASCGEPGGLLGLQLPGAGIFGIASYRVENCARLGRVMLVDNFWTLELSRSAPGRALLATSLEVTAARRGCGAVRQVLPCGEADGETARTLRNHLALADPSGERRFNRGTDCACGNLQSFSTAELFPAR